VRSYGTLRGLQVEDEETPEAAEDDKCPDCGSTCVIDLGPASHSQLSFDFHKKTFRVVRPPTEADHALHLVRRTNAWRLSTSPESVAIAVEARRNARRYEKGVALRFAA
jgi:hypothetical protein